MFTNTPITTVSLTDEWSLSSSSSSSSTTDHHSIIIQPVSDFCIPAEVHLLLQPQLGVTDWGCGHNDTDYRWIGKRDWLFRRTLPPIPPGRWHKVILELQVDTVATVSIDNISVGRTENQFVRYRFDITKVCCQLAENQRRPTLSILVHSASETARRLHDSYPYDVPDDFVPELQGEPHRNFIRKQQCSFGWDWGPCFLNSAVLHAQLLCFAERSVKIDGMVPIISRHSNGVDWLIMVDYWLLRNGDQSENSLTVSAVVKASDGQVMAECSQPSGTEQKSLELCVKQPELWWPNGHGDQPLYQLCLSIADRTNSQAVLDSAAVSIAFRQVELVQQLDADHQGSCFRFAVNGKPIFAKGANFIPVDAFNTRVTRERLELLLRQGLDANMNMLRVWGGGLYQPSEFYDFCDRNGLLVWQEFMFACAMYPTNQLFLESVRAEVEQQVKRLAHHPCICLWSGNNENEEALVTAWYEPVRRNPYIFTVDYHRLYHETIMVAVQKLDRSRAFVSSLPSNGVIAEHPFTERYKVDRPHRFGDTHYYNYRDLGTDVLRYPQCRFASEYGFQAFPCWPTYSRISRPADWHPMSAFNVQRNHHRNGQPELLHQMRLLFNEIPFPQSLDESCSPELFENYCLLTQIVQVLCIKAQTEHYRRQMGKDMFCMGALYWQYNDIWEAPSWAGLDISGRWKLLHNAIKDIFQPLWVSGFLTPNGKLEVHVSNDSLVDREVKCLLSFWRYSTNSIAKTVSVDLINVHSMTSFPIFNLESVDSISPLNDLLVQLECSSPDGSRLLCSNVIFAPSFHGTKLNEPKIELKPLNDRSEGDFYFEVRTDKIAPFVCLEESLSDPLMKPGGRFHPNGFTLFPGCPITVGYRRFNSDNHNFVLPPTVGKIKTLFDTLSPPSDQNHQN